MRAHCGWRVSRARRTTTCALARRTSECDFYLEHFVVQLYLYAVCILCIFTLVYFLFMSFAHSRQFLQLLYFFYYCCIMFIYFYYMNISV